MTTRRKAPSNGFVSTPVEPVEELSQEPELEIAQLAPEPVVEQVLEEIQLLPILQEPETLAPVVAPLLTSPIHVDFKRKEVAKQPKVVKQPRNQPRFTAHK